MDDILDRWMILWFWWVILWFWWVIFWFWGIISRLRRTMITSVDSKYFF